MQSHEREIYALGKADDNFVEAYTRDPQADFSQTIHVYKDIIADQTIAEEFRNHARFSLATVYILVAANSQEKFKYLDIAVKNFLEIKGTIQHPEHIAPFLVTQFQKNVLRIKERTSAKPSLNHQFIQVARSNPSLISYELLLNLAEIDVSVFLVLLKNPEQREQLIARLQQFGDEHTAFTRIVALHGSEKHPETDNEHLFIYLLKDPVFNQFFNDNSIRFILENYREMINDKSTPEFIVKKEIDFYQFAYSVYTTAGLPIDRLVNVFEALGAESQTTKSDDKFAQHQNAVLEVILQHADIDTVSDKYYQSFANLLFAMPADKLTTSLLKIKSDSKVLYRLLTDVNLLEMLGQEAFNTLVNHASNAPMVIVNLLRAQPSYMVKVKICEYIYTEICGKKHIASALLDKITGTEENQLQKNINDPRQCIFNRLFLVNLLLDPVESGLDEEQISELSTVFVEKASLRSLTEHVIQLAEDDSTKLYERLNSLKTTQAKSRLAFVMITRNVWTEKTIEQLIEHLEMEDVIALINQMTEKPAWLNTIVQSLLNKKIADNINDYVGRARTELTLTEYLLSQHNLHSDMGAKIVTELTAKLNPDSAAKFAGYTYLVSQSSDANELVDFLVNQIKQAPNAETAIKYLRVQPLFSLLDKTPDAIQRIAEALRDKKYLVDYLNSHLSLSNSDRPMEIAIATHLLKNDYENLSDDEKYLVVKEYFYHGRHNLSLDEMLHVYLHSSKQEHTLRIVVDGILSSNHYVTALMQASETKKSLHIPKLINDVYSFDLSTAICRLKPSTKHSLADYAHKKRNQIISKDSREIIEKARTPTNNIFKKFWYAFKRKVIKPIANAFSKNKPSIHASQADANSYEIGSLTAGLRHCPTAVARAADDAAIHERLTQTDQGSTTAKPSHAKPEANAATSHTSWQPSFMASTAKRMRGLFGMTATSAPSQHS